MAVDLKKQSLMGSKNMRQLINLAINSFIFVSVCESNISLEGSWGTGHHGGVHQVSVDPHQQDDSPPSYHQHHRDKDFHHRVALIQINSTFS